MDVGMANASGLIGSLSHIFRTLFTDADTDTDDRNYPNDFNEFDY